MYVDIDRFYKEFDKNDKVLVIIRPDPDSIGSALGIAFLLKKLVKKTDIAKIGTIKRLDNQAMVRILKIRLLNYFKIDLSSYSRFIMVDGQPHHFPEEVHLPELTAVIDHHPCTTSREEIPYLDVRPCYGSNSAIIEEYIFQQGKKIPPRLATALYYGIKSDTNSFERSGGTRDIVSFSRLTPRVRFDLIKLIERWEFTRHSIPYIKKAFNRIHLSRSTLFAFLGKVDDPDILVIVADFLTHVGGITLCVTGAVHNDKLSLVFRSDGIRRSAEKLAVHSFSKYGSAGGHKTAARAEIPLENIKDQVESFREDYIEEFIVNKLKINSRRKKKKTD